MSWSSDDLRLGFFVFGNLGCSLEMLRKLEFGMSSADFDGYLHSSSADKCPTAPPG